MASWTEQFGVLQRYAQGRILTQTFDSAEEAQSWAEENFHPGDYPVTIVKILGEVNEQGVYESNGRARRTLEEQGDD